MPLCCDKHSHEMLISHNSLPDIDELVFITIFTIFIFFLLIKKLYKIFEDKTKEKIIETNSRGSML